MPWKLEYDQGDKETYDKNKRCKLCGHGFKTHEIYIDMVCLKIESIVCAGKMYSCTCDCYISDDMSIKGLNEK